MPRSIALAVAVATVLAPTPTVFARMLKCPPDAVAVGNVCIDRYEASVWQIDPSNTRLVKKIDKGEVTLADLTAAGATQLGCPSPPFGHVGYPALFPNDGNWTPVAGTDPPSAGVYAVSVKGVLPTACTTWFQANQACALSGKRLLRNAEWQRAAAGTPDPGTDDGTSDCNIATAGHPVDTGSRSKCTSNWGVFDLVGNVDEWVEDWGDRDNTGCTNWTRETGIAGSDFSCVGGSGGGAVVEGGGAPYNIPGAFHRGGSWSSFQSAGVFAVSTLNVPSDGNESFGFRCAR